jgi:anti-anti-sigma regulatory factor
MLRISEERSTDGATVLRLAGRVIGPWVEELRQSCEAAMGLGGTLVIDLADVSFADADGVRLFQEMVTRRVILTNCSPFLTERLKESSDGPRFCTEES